LKTPTDLAPRELTSAQQSAPMKRSASCDAVAVDDVHQPPTSHQSAMKQAVSATSAGDLRYRKMRLSAFVNHFCINLLSLSQVLVPFVPADFLLSDVMPFLLLLHLCGTIYPHTLPPHHRCLHLSND